VGSGQWAVGSGQWAVGSEFRVAQDRLLISNCESYFTFHVCRFTIDELAGNKINIKPFKGVNQTVDL
jgi:hypothetical protein